MIALLDSSEALSVAESEIGMPVGQLITPLTRFRNRGAKFAIDNGGYSGANADGFMSLLEREYENRSECLFVAVPDVVADARRTLECFDYWYRKLAGWRLAFVAQDGIEQLSIPWKLVDAVFIGGSTQWKLSRYAESVIRCAKWQRKWVHVGRVNSVERFVRFENLGVDSVDGSGISRYSHMRVAIKNRADSPQLSLLNGNSYLESMRETK